MTFTKQKVKQFRSDFTKAVSQLEKDFGCSIELGTIRFDADEFRVKLTAKQEKDLAEFKAKDRKVEMAIGGVVGNESISKYNQRPDYQAYAEGDVVEDEMPDEDMPPMEELKVEEESLLQPMGMDDEMPMDDEEDITDEDLEGMDAIIDTSALSDEEEQLLDEAVEMHPELEAIIPKLVATEFTAPREMSLPPRSMYAFIVPRPLCV